MNRKPLRVRPTKGLNDDCNCGKRLRVNDPKRKNKSRRTIKKRF